jgi:hypothetical protein
MANNTPRKWLEKVFIKKVWSDGDRPLPAFMLGVGAVKEDLLAQIEAIPADDRGFINFTIGTQKKDPTKYSIWQDEGRRDNPPTTNRAGYPAGRSSGGNSGGYQPRGDQSSAQQQNNYSTDDLPF